MGQNLTLRPKKRTGPINLRTNSTSHIGHDEKKNMEEHPKDLSSHEWGHTLEELGGGRRNGAS